MKKYKKGDIIHGSYFGNGWPFDGEIIYSDSALLNYTIRNSRTGEEQVVGRHEIIDYELWKNQKRPNKKVVKILNLNALKDRLDFIERFANGEELDPKYFNQAVREIRKSYTTLFENQGVRFDCPVKIIVEGSVGMETDRDNFVKSVDIKGDR